MKARSSIARAGSACGSGRPTTGTTSPTWSWRAPVTSRHSRRSLRSRSCGSDVPGLRIRVVNVVDLMRLQPASEHPHGLADQDFDALFTPSRPVVFAYHGYPWLIHRLTYRRTNHDNIHVRGYKEEGTTTTPFDMSPQRTQPLSPRHGRDRPCAGARSTRRRIAPADGRRAARPRAYTRDDGEDSPEVRDWTWPA